MLLMIRTLHCCAVAMHVFLRTLLCTLILHTSISEIIFNFDFADGPTENTTVIEFIEYDNKSFEIQINFTKIFPVPKCSAKIKVRIMKMMIHNCFIKITTKFVTNIYFILFIFINF